MRFGSKTVLAVGVVTSALTFATAAQAYLPSLTIQKCLAGKVKSVGKAAAAYTGCYSKAASKNLAVDGTCLGKAGAKLVSALDKADLKPPCEASGTSAARQADAAAFGSSINTQVGDGDLGAGKCDAAKQKLVGKYVAAVMGCYSKAAGKAPGLVDNAPGGCTDKALVKFQNGVNKAELKPPCTNSGAGPLVALQLAVNQYIDVQACALDSTNPNCPDCGNGVIDLGEDCDPGGGPANSCQNQSNTSAAVLCNGSCQCACPSIVTFSGDANAPESILDTGWTGISHRAPIITNGDVSVTLGGCTGSSRPCGTCNVSGPVANPNAGAGQLDTRRCSNDTSVSCTSAAQCGAHCIGGTNEGGVCPHDTACPGGTCIISAGTCEDFFGSMLPLAAGGVTTCVVNSFSSPITGTANVETGEAVTVANLRAVVYTGIAIDNPCPRCTGDTSFNDNVNGGFCDAGPRAGKPCDKNGSIPGRPDFGETSLDCPLAPGGIIATLPIDLSNKTDPVVRTLTAASPTCSGSVSEKCLCDTCNNGVAESCMSNADCPANGGGAGICGGVRCIGGVDGGQPCQTCIGGTNHGGQCSNVTACPGGGTCPNPRQCVAGANAGAGCSLNSQCPGSTCATTCAGGQCSRPGEPTKPSACLDDTSTPDFLDCFDDGDGEGTCGQGPVDNNCSLGSGHAQRGCTFDSECGGGVGSCETVNRRCFLTGGGSFLPGAKAGTDTLIAVGMEDPPMNDVSHPTLGSVFCVNPTGSSAVNNVAGLPGPSRITIKGTAVGLP